MDQVELTLRVFEVMASKVTGPIDPESTFWKLLLEHASNNADFILFLDTDKGRKLRSKRVENANW